MQEELQDPLFIDEIQISFEKKGYHLFNDILSIKNLQVISHELSILEDSYKDYHANDPYKIIMNEPTRFMIHNLQFERCPEVHKLLYNGYAQKLISKITGDNLICTGFTYAHCRPGYLGIPLHTDYDPYDSNTYRPSNPIALRVLYYLDDLSPNKAALRLLPYSHNCLHKSRKYNEIIQERVADEINITCKAGSSVIINTRVFHGVTPNTTLSGRRVIAITYRPEWAAPLRPVQEHPPELISGLSPELLPFFNNLNKF